MKNKKEVAVIYKSKYSSAKKYAGWIGIKLDADLYEESHVRARHLKGYKTIVYVGGIYMNKINGINIINKNYYILHDKNIVVLGVGLNEYNEEVYEEILNNNFSDEVKKDIKLFYLRGAFDYKKINIVDKCTISSIRAKILFKDKSKVTKKDREVLTLFENTSDFTNKYLVNDIVNYITEKA